MANTGGDTTSGKVATPVEVVEIFGLRFNRNDPLTYIIFLGILTVVLLLVSYKNEGIATGMALTVLFAVAIAHK